MLRRVLFALVAIAIALASFAPLASAAPVRDPRDFTLINGSSITFINVYVAPSSSNDWGSDILGQDVLAPGQTVTIHFQRFDGSTCYYDIQVKGPNGETGELNQVDLCNTTTVTFS